MKLLIKRRVEYKHRTCHYKNFNETSMIWNVALDEHLLFYLRHVSKYQAATRFWKMFRREWLRQLFHSTIWEDNLRTVNQHEAKNKQQNWNKALLSNQVCWITQSCRTKNYWMSKMSLQISNSPSEFYFLLSLLYIIDTYMANTTKFFKIL